MRNGNMELRDRGKTAFNFYDRASGRSARFCYVTKEKAVCPLCGEECVTGFMEQRDGKLICRDCLEKQ